MTSYCGRTVEKKTILDNSLTSETILRITAKKKKYQNYVKLEKFRKIRNILEDEKYPGRKKRSIEARDRA